MSRILKGVKENVWKNVNEDRKINDRIFHSVKNKMGELLIAEWF